MSSRVETISTPTEASMHSGVAPGVCLHRWSAVDDPRSSDTPMRATPASCCVEAWVERTAREEFHKSLVPGLSPQDLEWEAFLPRIQEQTLEWAVRCYPDLPADWLAIVLHPNVGRGWVRAQMAREWRVLLRELGYAAD